MNDKAGEIADKCIECGLCGVDCLLLSALGESPKQLAVRGLTAWESFSCTLCGACAAVCPAGLSPMEMFAAGRRSAVAAGEISMDQYRYLMPDRNNNLMSVYRQYSGIDYSDISIKGKAVRCFFPGCTLMTYAPDLTREVYARLRDECGCGGLVADCCGKPLAQLGLPNRANKAAEKLLVHLTANNVRELIVACPGCYYELRPLLEQAGVAVRTVYEAISLPASGVEGGGRVCTVHDSCPDRFAGIFGSQVRGLLTNSGFTVIETAHSKKHTACCGSGGMVSHFRPDLTEALVNRRLAETKQAGADLLVSCCVSCTLKFAAAADGIGADYALSLFLGRRDNYADAKGKVAKMLAGPQGDQIWTKIMADDVSREETCISGK